MTQMGTASLDASENFLRSLSILEWSLTCSVRKGISSWKSAMMSGRMSRALDRRLADCDSLTVSA